MSNRRRVMHRLWRRALAHRAQMERDFAEAFGAVPYVCPGCYALPGEAHAGYCIDTHIEEQRERERELRDIYGDEFRDVLDIVEDDDHG